MHLTLRTCFLLSRQKEKKQQQKNKQPQCTTFSSIEKINPYHCNTVWSSFYSFLCGAKKWNTGSSFRSWLPWIKSSSGNKTDHLHLFSLKARISMVMAQK